MVLMMGRNIRFDAVIWKIIPKLCFSPFLSGFWSADEGHENNSFLLSQQNVL